MANIESYTNKGGAVVMRVRWRAGGTTNGERCAEPFTGKDADKRAERFRLDVELAGNNWPPNYVPKVGYVSAEKLAALEDLEEVRAVAAAEAKSATPFIPFAQDYVDGLSGIDDRTKADYQRMIVNHFVPFEAFAGADIADPETLTGDDVKAWTNWMVKGIRDPANSRAWERVPRSAKTTANVRGLLYSIIQSAIVREHPLRRWNPCQASSLPRLDSGEIDDDMTVLVPKEFEILYWAAHETVRPLLLGDVGSGMRFSEITAQWTKDYTPSDHCTFVRRTWRRVPGEGTVLREPKSEAGRRRIPLDDLTEEAFAQRSRGRALEALIFTSRSGSQLRHGNFWNRYWMPAVYRSTRCEEHRAVDRERGFLVGGELVRLTNMKDLRMRHLIPCGCAGSSRKVPRFHDLRHTYASWQLAHGILMFTLSVSMGHESSRTTEQTYAHLMPDHERKQAQAHAAALSGLRLMPSLSQVA